MSVRAVPINFAAMGNFSAIGPISSPESAAALITSFCVSFDIIDWRCIIYAFHSPVNHSLSKPIKQANPQFVHVVHIGPAEFGLCILPGSDQGLFASDSYPPFPPNQIIISLVTYWLVSEAKTPSPLQRLKLIPLSLSFSLSLADFRLWSLDELASPVQLIAPTSRGANSPSASTSSTCSEESCFCCCYYFSSQPWIPIHQPLIICPAFPPTRPPVPLRLLPVAAVAAMTAHSCSITMSPWRGSKRIWQLPRGWARYVS